MPTYNVKTQFPRSFTQQIFLKSGGSAILRMKGAFGVIDSEKNIPERDLNFILNSFFYTWLFIKNTQSSEWKKILLKSFDDHENALDQNRERFEEDNQMNLNLFETDSEDDPNLEKLHGNLLLINT